MEFANRLALEGATDLRGALAEATSPEWDLGQDEQSKQYSQQLLALSILLDEADVGSSSSSSSSHEDNHESSSDEENGGSNSSSKSNGVICNDRNVREAVQTIAVELVLRKSVVAPSA